MVVLIRIAGSVLACVRDGEAVRVRKVGVYVVKPADQSEAMALLRPHDSGGLPLLPLELGVQREEVNA